MNPTLLFILFTVVAFILMVLEVFVPGGILAVVGVICLITACGYAFAAFGPAIGGLVSVLLVFGTLGAFFVWLIMVPNTRFGARMALQSDLQDSKSAKDEDSLIGQSGTAETDLRPSGYARINGRRHDVVSSRGYLEKGTRVEVTEVHGMRIVVRPCQEESPA